MKSNSEIEVSIKGRINTPRMKKTDLENILDLIYNEGWKPQIDEYRASVKEKGKEHEDSKKLKSLLPNFFTVLYDDDNGGVNKMEASGTATGIMIFDLDVYDAEQVEQFREELFAKLKKYIHFTFISPTGGLKFAIKTDVEGRVSPDEPELYDIHFEAYKDISEKFKKLGIDVGLDDVTRNLNRACYISSDSELYYNPSSVKHLIKEKTLQKVREKQEEETKRRAEAAKHRAFNPEHRTEIAQKWFDAGWLRNVLPLAQDAQHNAACYAVVKETIRCGFDEQYAADKIEDLRLLGAIDSELRTHNDVRAYVQRAWKTASAKIFPAPELFTSSTADKKKRIMEIMKAKKEAQAADRLARQKL